MADTAPVKSRLDAFFSLPAAAVVFSVVCNLLWGCAFPFIKLGYRLFAIDTADTPSILCFAGVRFMVSSVLVLAFAALAQRRVPPLPRGRSLAACCALGLWQTSAQYTFFYMAAALLTGALGTIINSSSSFMGVILAHFLYGKSDRLTLRKTLGCVIGFAGVLAAAGGEGSGSARGIVYILLAAAIFASSGPMNKAVTQSADSFAACAVNLGVGGFVLLALGLALGGSLHPQSAMALPVLAFLAFISGAGYVLWALLMKNNPVSRISVFNLLIPVVATLLSAVLNGEALFEWRYLAAMALVCSGIWLVNRPAKERAHV